MKYKTIIYTLVLLLVTSELLAAGKTTSCSYVYDQIKKPINNDINVLLFDSAVKNNNCPSNNKWSIKDANRTTIENLIILHDENEDIDMIKSITKINIKFIEKHLADDIKESKDNLKANFADARLSAYTDSIQELCGITIKLTISKNKKLWLISYKPIARYEFCLNTAAILAAHYVTLKYEDGVFTE